MQGTAGGLRTHNVLNSMSVNRPLAAVHVETETPSLSHEAGFRIDPDGSTRQVALLVRRLDPAYRISSDPKLRGSFMELTD
jgi:hypothetical protein